MSSYIFTLSGRRTNELSVDFNPPIELDEKFNYSLALIGFHTYHSIPNIDASNSKFYYKDEGGEDKGVVIPTGSYEIADIEHFLQNYLHTQYPSQHDDETLLYLKPNNNTLKSEIESNILDIDFRPNDSVGRLLGFSNRLLEKKKRHESDLPVDIVKVVTIRVNCNMVVGSYTNGHRTHTLFEFSPSVQPGYAINIEPNNLIYLPINTHRIENISVTLLDQKSRPVDFRDEEIIVRLELKKE